MEIAVEKKSGKVQKKIAQVRPIYTQEMEDAAVDALRNGMYLRSESVVRFEEEFAKYIGTKYAVGMNSGTDALTFILLALGSKNKNFLTTTWSFIATANSIVHAGGNPILADASSEDYCLDPQAAKTELKKTTVSGIIPVHLYGQPFDYETFAELGETYHAPIIEDACQAHGAIYKGKRVGSLGVAAAFSFYPTKNMSVLGDGGMVTTNDESIAKTVSKLRDSGRVSHYEHDIIGFTSRLQTVQAAIGRVQLRHLEEWNARRRRIAEIYHARLGSVNEILLPRTPNSEKVPVYHQFVIRTRERDSLKLYLEESGIQTGIHYPIPIHLQPLYKEKFRRNDGSFPHSERFAVECLSLPMYPLLSDDDVKIVTEIILDFYKKDN